MANLQKIRALCKEKHMTLKNLATNLDITQHAIQRMLKTNSTKIDTLEKIADFFDVSINIFFENTNDVINSLTDRNFSKTFDYIGSFSKDADLYYRDVTGRNSMKNFLVINHFNKKLEEHLQGFDLWLCIFQSEQDIGKRRPMNYVGIKLGFKEADMWLIDKIIP